MTTFTLNTGAKIPAVGFGTWQDADSQEKATLEAVKAGYRHIDTAAIYGTEPMVGKAIAESGVPRSELFIVTKLWNNKHAPSDVAKACDDSIKKLGVEYLDLYLMHWPVAWKAGDEKFPKDQDGNTITEKTDYVETYKEMEKLVKVGKVKAIGISNFSKGETERILSECSVVPAAHQLELHPYLQQKPFVEWLQSKGIHTTAYSPFGNQNESYDGASGSRVIDDAKLVEIGKKYQKSGAQVALAWGIAKGHSVIPKSKTPSRIKANLEGDFKLSAEDVKEIDAIDKKKRFNNPTSFGYKFYTDLDAGQ